MAYIEFDNLPCNVGRHPQKSHALPVAGSAYEVQSPQEQPPLTFPCLSIFEDTGAMIV